MSHKMRGTIHFKTGYPIEIFHACGIWEGNTFSKVEINVILPHKPLWKQCVFGRALYSVIWHLVVYVYYVRMALRRLILFAPSVFLYIRDTWRSRRRAGAQSLLTHTGLISSANPPLSWDFWVIMFVSGLFSSSYTVLFPAFFLSHSLSGMQAHKDTGTRRCRHTKMCARTHTCTHTKT